MRILCRHGYFMIYPQNSVELSEFQQIFGVTLYRLGDYYTFKGLKDLPDYTLKGSVFGNTIASKTFEGRPWDLMRENSLVYNLAQDILVPKNTIIKTVNLILEGRYWVSRYQRAIFQPGSVSNGKKIFSYDSNFSTKICDQIILELGDDRDN